MAFSRYINTPQKSLSKAASRKDKLLPIVPLPASRARESELRMFSRASIFFFSSADYRIQSVAGNDAFWHLEVISLRLATSERRLTRSFLRTRSKQVVAIWNPSVLLAHSVLPLTVAKQRMTLMVLF